MRSLMRSLYHRMISLIIINDRLVSNISLIATLVVPVPSLSLISRIDYLLGSFLLFVHT